MMLNKQHKLSFPLANGYTVCYPLLSLMNRYVFGNLLCLFVSNITLKVINGLQQNFTEGSGAVKGKGD